MAGLFQLLLRCRKRQGLRQARARCNGTDGEPLILPMGDGEHDVIERICTRPFACDLDGDGDCSTSSPATSAGTFGFFKGEGKGKFAPQADVARRPNGETMQVPTCTAIRSSSTGTVTATSTC